MGDHRPPGTRPATRRDQNRPPLRLVPPVPPVPDEDVEPVVFTVPDPGSPTYHADLLALIQHARADVRQRAQRIAHEARMIGEVAEMADALTSVVLP